ncbi:spfh domain / band 7 family protein [Cystobacter fuscus DSM 2262]|uniref:Spfh domain / band 7 family protein n=1 Tax=Cystobacter fuscus (strain ATCC 25194 / DSM 2262 / NBRC 100088 / M29) TaxID=1242864 RepID=S9P6V6_CYSF2|nr:prohibitin family protein [Cystobacter fuscus]EPX58911.1 spfh domain / band 7 family protein [Cystobacter fuscus DSM 2262]
MNEQHQNETQQQEQRKHGEEKRGEFLRKMSSLAGEATRGMVSRVRWLIYAERGRRVMAGLAVTGMVAGVVAAQPVCMIEPGEVGIRVNRFTGKVAELREGWAVLVPRVHRLSRYSLKDQSYQPTRSTRATDPAPFQSVEGLSIGVEVTIRYVLDPERIPALAARLPEDIGRDLVEPVIDGVLRRHFAQHTVREIFSTHRVKIQQDVSAELSPLLAADGVIVRSVTLGNVDLPQQYRTGMEALLAEELNAEKMRYTLELKDKQVKQSALEAEADKVRREKAAEAAGNEEIIAAKAKAEAMRHVLPFKEKEIEQRRLEAEAAKVSRLTQASAEAEAHRIEAAGEADARRKLAEADAYRVDVTGKASSEQLARDAELISRNPLLIQKTLADKLSDKIQVIIAPPQAGGFIAGNLLGQPQEARYAGGSSKGASLAQSAVSENTDSDTTGSEE